MLGTMFEMLSNIHENLMDVQRIPVLALAYLLTVATGMVTGPFRGNANPFAWEALDLLFGNAGDKLNKANRSVRDLLTRGLLFSIILISLCFVVAQQVDVHFLRYADLIWESLVISLFITTGAVWFSVLRVFFAMDKDVILEGAYFSLARSSRMNLNSTDRYGITREGVSYLAVSFDKGFVAPSLWYLIGGFPLLVLYAAASFLAWRYGQFGVTKGFGRVALAIEKVMGYAPSLLSGFFLYCASSVTPTAKMKTAILQWWRNRDAFSYEQHGSVVSAMAWPLEISLGGPIQDLSGKVYKRAWIGPEGASAQLERHHLKRAIFMNVIAHLLFFVALLTVYVYAGKLG